MGASNRFLAQCRGAARGYLAFEVPVSKKVRASSHAGGREVPCSVFELDGGSAIVREAGCRAGGRVVVVTVPLLEARQDVSLIATDDGTRLVRTIFDPKLSGLQSRLLTMRKPVLATFLRGVDTELSSLRAHVQLLEIWPDGSDGGVLRIPCRFPTDDAAAELYVELRDGRTLEPVELSWSVLEDHVVPSEIDPSFSERVVMLSLAAPAGVRNLIIEAGLAGHEGCRDFTSVCERSFAGLRGHFGMLAEGGAPDRDYTVWFEEHRATPELLARQRERSAAHPGPLMSIVVPVFRTPPAYLRACIDSVLAQSYTSWELVLVNASGPDAGVDGVLAEVSDPRVRVLQIENASISENTNAGIAAAMGEYVAFLDHDDVLEPDALWCFAEAIARNPESDLLYCDEDHLRDGVYAAPAFKPAPSLTRLHGHNYITHLLMVSRRVLGLAERSGSDVAGAQDYDLTLKAFDVARHIEHVPRVLYHWREHEGSTAGGGNQKPYAHTAGALALKRHLERRGWAGEVLDGPLPYTYRVRFDVPDPAPLVSIVIPSRDHADLLEACASSILQKTEYPNFEIVVVENGSENPETFELYGRLQEDGRVRVITWTPGLLAPDAPTEHGFNYSALVNYGAAHARGELLLFLNNDTEVIESAWLSEMVGCLEREDVGVVGAKLLFPDGLVQHAGMSVRSEGGFSHVNRNLAASIPGYGFSAGMSQEYSMVTGACQLTRRSLFEDIGGYDERLAVGYNDGDYCLSARERGYVVVYQASAVLQHKEFASRGREATDARLRARLFRERSYTISKHPAFFSSPDPAVNSNFNPDSDWWELVVGLCADHTL